MTWERVPLKQLGEWYGGGTPSKSNPAFWVNGDVPWLSPKDMGSEVLQGTQDRVTREAVSGSSTKLVPPNSVAVVTRSGILERTIPVALVPFATTMNQDMKAVVPRAGIDPRWIAWGLRAFERELLRDTRKAGTTVASIEMPRWYGFELPVPPLEEQRRIVAILEDHLSHLDAADVSLEAAFARTKALDAQVLTQALESTPYEDGRLASLLEQPLANGRSVQTREGGFPVLRLTALTDARIDLSQRKPGAWTAEEADRFRVHPGDFLISRGNGSLRLVGRGGLVGEVSEPVAFPDTLIRARPCKKHLDAGFLALVWNAASVRQQIEQAAKTTAGIYKVNQKDLGRILLPVPVIAEQRRIVSEVSAERENLDRLEQSANASRTRSAALRRSLLTAAFSGRLTGNPQPASDLGTVMSA